MNMSRLGKSFPVADGFFSSVELTENHLTELRARVNDAVHETLASCYQYQQNRRAYLVDAPAWRPYVECGGLKAYTRKHEMRETTGVTHAFGAVEGNYFDIAKFLKTETREDFLQRQKLMFDCTIDGDVVHSVPRANALTWGYEGIKWAAFKLFSVRYRLDTCCFESVGRGVDDNGKPYAFRVLLPMEIPEVPHLYDSKRTLRVTMKNVMILTPSDRGSNSTEVFVAMENDFKGQRIPRSVFKRYLGSLHKISSYMDRQRVLVRPLDATSTAQADQPQCSVCSRSFSLIRSRHSCTVCGDVVCRKCFVKSSSLVLVKSQKRDDVSAYKICTPCIKRLREDVEQAIAKPRPSENESFVWRKTYHLDKIETPRYDEAATCVDGCSILRQPDAVSPIGAFHDIDTLTDCSWTSEDFGLCSDLDRSSDEVDSKRTLLIDENDEDEEAEYMRSRFTIELDTSQMKRVRGDSALHMRSTFSPSETSPPLLNTIQSSINEMEELLQKLQRVCRHQSI